jgi:hypothetical protein
MYVILNFLSFESVNAGKLFFRMFNACGLHNISNVQTLYRQRLGVGYVVSFSYKEIANLFKNCTFILIKEEPSVVLSHLLFGYYNNLYSSEVLNDFTNYFKINFENLTEETLTPLITNYYNEVETFFGDSLITIDLKQFENSMHSFAYGEDFLIFAKKLTEVIKKPAQLKKFKLFQEYVLSNVIPIDLKDYFIHSENYGLPEKYPTNQMPGNSMPPQITGNTPPVNSWLTLFLAEFEDPKIMEALWTEDYIAHGANRISNASKNNT